MLVAISTVNTCLDVIECIGFYDCESDHGIIYFIL